MATTYAKGTVVTVDQSLSEIRRLLTRYGASGFIVGEAVDKAQLAFEMEDRRVVFRLLLPLPEDGRFDLYRGRQTTTGERTMLAQQATREKWRALVLCIKAKLEIVASGIETFDQAFMANLLLASGETVGEWAGRPENQRALFGGNHPPLLPGPRDA